MSATKRELRPEDREPEDYDQREWLVEHERLMGRRVTKADHTAWGDLIAVFRRHQAAAFDEGVQAAYTHASLVANTPGVTIGDIVNPYKRRDDAPPV